MKKIILLILFAGSLFGQPRQTINNADFKGVSHILSGQSLVADAGSILTGFPGTGTVTSVDVAGGTTGLTFSGGPIINSGTITVGGILAKANGGTGTATPALVAGTGIQITGSWPSQTITSTAAGGSVTTFSVVTANGVSASVANASTTPAATFSLGAITPTSVNGQTITTGSGTLTIGSNTLTASGNATVSGTHTGTSSGTNTGDQTITLTGDATGSGAGSFSVNVGKINGTALSGLSSGLLKNTTTTGVPSIAAPGTDYVVPAGNVATATALQVSRTINGVSFNGTANITIPALASALTGSTLASGVTASSLLSAAGGAFGTAAFTPASNYEVPLSFTAPLSRSSNTVSVANAAADGTTRGVSTFTAADFNAASGVISIDYANGQASSATNKGFLSSADWTTFNAKASTSGTLAQFATTSSAELYGVIGDPVGTGNLVFNTGPTITGGTIIGTTQLSLRSQGSGAWDMVVQNTENLTNTHFLTIGLGDGDRGVNLSGNLTVPADATVSGTNTGDQTIVLTGDVTGSGTGSITASLVTNGVSAGAYTRANITVDATGRVTVANNGSAVNLASDVTGILPGANGGTGVNNSGKTITLGGNFITSGAFAATLTYTATSNSTMPAGTHSIAPLDTPVFTTNITTPKVIWTGSVNDTTGTGTPEGAVTSPVGSVFRRTDGSSGTTLYVKESGTGNTGWAAHGASSGTINSGTSGNVAVYSASTTISGTSTPQVTGIGVGIASTSNRPIYLTPTASTSSFFAYGVSLGGTLTATANNDAVIWQTIGDGLATFSTGTFTGLTQTMLKVTGSTIGGSGTITNKYGIYVSAGTGATNNWDFYSASQPSFFQGIVMETAKPLSIKSGTDQRAGNATLVGGTVTVLNTTVTANTMVMLTRKTSGGTIGSATYTVSAGTSFTINSDNALDTSVFSYLLVEVP